MIPEITPELFVFGLASSFGLGLALGWFLWPREKPAKFHRVETPDNMLSGPIGRRDKWTSWICVSKVWYRFTDEAITRARENAMRDMQVGIRPHD